MEITRMLTISTAHVSKETAAKLDYEDGFAWECCLAIYRKEDCGWLIFVDAANLSSKSIPEDLKACLALARAKNCEWLCLDCDGEALGILPTYDW